MGEPARSEDDIHQDGFPARLRQALAAYGSVTSVARAIDRSEGAVRKWLRGASEPSVRDLRALSMVTGASVEWLVTGRGASGLVADSVSEPRGSYRQTSTPMDYGLLESVLNTVEGEMRASGLELTSTKRSTIVGTLYGLFRESGIIDADAVSRLIRLAA